MASTVEPCESNSAGLSSLSTTMEMFDTFKSSLKDDDKDSDEESFHLPMLGCDDDTDSINKDISGTNTPIAENEDDILNKFETIATPDLDPKIEESILKDIDDEILSTNQNENTADKKTESDNLSNVATDSVVENENESDESATKGDIFRDLEIVDELDGDDKDYNNEAESLIEINDESETKDCQDNIDEINESAQIEDTTVPRDEEVNGEEKNTEEKIADVEETQKILETEADAMVTEDAEEEMNNSENQNVMTVEDESKTGDGNPNEDSKMGEESIKEETSEQSKVDLREITDDNDSADRPKDSEEPIKEDAMEHCDTSVDEDELEKFNLRVDENVEDESIKKDGMEQGETNVDEDGLEKFKLQDENIGDDNSAKDSKQSDQLIQEDASEHNKANIDGVEEQSMDVDDQTSKEDMAEGSDENCDNDGDESLKKIEDTEMICDEDDDSLLKNLVKEVNEKLDGDEDEMMPDVKIPDVTIAETHVKSNVDDGTKDELIEEFADTSGNVENSLPDTIAPVESSLPDTIAAVENPSSEPIAIVEQFVDPIDTVENSSSSSIATSSDPIAITEHPSDPEVIAEHPSSDPIAIAEQTSLDPLTIAEQTSLDPIAVTEQTSLDSIADQTSSDSIAATEQTSKDPIVIAEQTSLDPIAIAEHSSSDPITIAELSSPNPAGSNEEIGNKFPEDTKTADLEESAMELDTVVPESQQISSEEVPESVEISSEVTDSEGKSVPKELNDTSNGPEVDEKETPSEDKEQPSSKISEKDEQTEPETASNNLACDDLLDVSIIRDLDEDIADAIEENTVQSSEKSDNDDQEDDKADNEIDETEELVNSSDKDERMDSEDGSNMCDQETSTNDEVTSDAVVDSESKDDDVVMKETEALPMAAKKMSVVENKDTIVQQNIPEEKKEETLKENRTALGKRSLSDSDNVEIASKKFRLSDVVKDEKTATEKTKKALKGSNLKTLISFENFMQNKKFSSKKLTRSDLEQFCLQKICEAIMHKTDVGELHQAIKKQEQIIDNLRKDLLQLSKQARDLDIVNKKLMNELKTQNGTRKPLVPLKITRSVGLQVKLNIGIEQTPRRKQAVVNTPKTPTTPANNASVLRNRNITPANSNVVRQVHQPTAAAAPAPTPTASHPAPTAAHTAPTPPPAPSPRKTPATPILSQALQQRATPTNAPKRLAVRPKTPAEPPNAPNPGVIDLTDEDAPQAKTAQQQGGKTAQQQGGKTAQQQGGKTAHQGKMTQQGKMAQQGKTAQGTPVKILNKNMPVVQQRTLNVVQSKNGGANKIVGQANAGQQAKGPQRPMTSLPQGVRLTSTQLKNGLTLPAGVVTSSASGTPQLMYVVQPSSLTSSAGGTQKAVLLNFQPTSQVLTSTMNGSTVSMLSSKGANTVQLKTLVPRKHPAPLPLPPPTIINACLKPLLPKPHLSIRKTDTGIILQWRMPYNLDAYEGIASYQLFAYQETNAPPTTDMWRKVGDVKALALPMACTLTQFADKNKYYFAVRSVDVHKRIGAFSDPEEISL